MANRDRKAAKVRAVSRRLDEISGNREYLLDLLDETKLDLMILALGIATIELPAAS